MYSSSPYYAYESDNAPEKLKVCVIESVGLGVRSLTAFSKGSVIDHFTGKISSRIKQHSLQVSDGKHISETQFIGYLTHSCDPNARLDMTKFELIARRPIRSGEVVTIDYAETEDRLFVQFACACRAKNCRQWITGRKEAINAAGVDYLAAKSAGKARA
ncbi:MAG: SET domain-containing protein-lysine N-methyltransferase [Pseudomonadota bacterium]